MNYVICPEYDPSDLICRHSYGISDNGRCPHAGTHMHTDSCDIKACRNGPCPCVEVITENVYLNMLMEISQEMYYDLKWEESR